MKKIIFTMAFFAGFAFSAGCFPEHKASPGERGESCSEDRPCGSDLVCKDNVCILALEGEMDGPCYPNNTCNQGLLCIDDTCQSSTLDASAQDTTAADNDSHEADAHADDLGTTADTFVPGDAHMDDAGPDDSSSPNDAWTPTPDAAASDTARSDTGQMDAGGFADGTMVADSGAPDLSINPDVVYIDGSSGLDTVVGLDSTVDDTSRPDTTAPDITVADTASPELPLLDAAAPATTDEQIQAIIDQARDGASATGQIDGAFVTYTKPTIGNDPAGFFIQGSQMGPALFVETDPGALGLSVGLNINLSVLQTNIISGRVQIVQLENVVINSTGHSMASLTQHVSSETELISQVTRFESELITVTGVITGDFSNGGLDFAKAGVATAGIPNDWRLMLRVPYDLKNDLRMRKGCHFQVSQTPLWRYRTTQGIDNAQISAWSTDDIVISECPPFEVVRAFATGPTEIRVIFNDAVDYMSVDYDGYDFSISGGLTVSGAITDGRAIIVDTAAQVAGVQYTVAASTSVRSSGGEHLDANANSAVFVGFETPAELRMTEVAPSQDHQNDLIELVALSSGPIGGIKLDMDYGDDTLAWLPGITVTAGDVIVVHLNPSQSWHDAPDSETSSKSHYPNSAYSANLDNVWDLHPEGYNDTIPFSNRVIGVYVPAESRYQDVVPFARSDADFTPPGSFPYSLQAIQDDGLWLPADCSGEPCYYDTIPSATDVSADWTGVPRTRGTPASNTIQRNSSVDTDSAADWQVGASNWGSVP